MNQPPTPNSAEMALEDRIAEMAPQEPDILRLYDAVKELQLAWNIESEIEVSHSSKTQVLTVLRRTTASGIDFNMAVLDGRYINGCQHKANRYDIAYPNFDAAACGFLERQPSTKYRGERVAR